MGGGGVSGGAAGEAGDAAPVRAAPIDSWRQAAAMASVQLRISSSSPAATRTRILFSGNTSGAVPEKTISKAPRLPGMASASWKSRSWKGLTSLPW